VHAFGGYDIVSPGAVMRLDRLLVAASDEFCWRRTNFMQVLLSLIVAGSFTIVATDRAAGSLSDTSQISHGRCSGCSQANRRDNLCCNNLTLTKENDRIISEEGSPRY